MKTKFTLFVILLFCIVFDTPAQLFKKGDRVCFVGNSITHAGEFHHNILQYYVTRFPESPVAFYNCGISGDVTGGVLNRLESDVLVHKPTHAVIMIGMNDVMRYLYGSAITLSADTLKKRENSLLVYRKNLDSIVRILIDKKVSVILQKPSIFDQTAKIARPNNLGVNDALKTCADYMQTLADKYKLQTVDYWSIMTEINKTIQQKDSSATVVGADRIHPGATGNLIMAYQFLRTTKSPTYISKIAVAKNAMKGKSASANCTVTKLKYNAKGVEFICKENALPFTFSESQNTGLSLVPIMQELNQEILQVSDLTFGNYELRIDSTLIGIFSSEELLQGVNLASLIKTPQYRQSETVKKELTKLWENEAKLRTISYMDIKYLNDFKNKSDLNLSVAYLDSLFTAKFPTNTYLKTQMQKYKVVKPNAKMLEKEADELRSRVYQLAQPVSHRFMLVSKER